MNELIFIFHMMAAAAAIRFSLHLGKEALITLVALMALLANFFVLKQIELLGFTVTCSDVFAIADILSLNLLQVRFGKESAQKAITISLGAFIFFALFSQIHLLYLPSSYDTAHSHYAMLLSPSPRLLLASLTTFAIVQYFDVQFFAYLRRRLQTNWQLLSVFSILVSQALDTVLFSFLGLYGLVASMTSIIIISYALKVVTLLVLSSLQRHRTADAL
ncbi:MAG: queuosine precursor transporter [Verrucomicrobia bacterium]|nr:queuosine precursor transporter [Verrucomicrobiota bacterium]